jgi:hypothetical protein
MGAAFEILEGRWVLDSRGIPSGLVIEIQPMVELVIVGVAGVVYLYHVLRDEPRRAGDTVVRATN